MYFIFNRSVSGNAVKYSYHEGEIPYRKTTPAATKNNTLGWPTWESNFEINGKPVGPLLDKVATVKEPMPQYPKSVCGRCFAECVSQKAFISEPSDKDKRFVILNSEVKMDPISWSKTTELELLVVQLILLSPIYNSDPDWCWCPLIYFGTRYTGAIPAALSKLPLLDVLNQALQDPIYKGIDHQLALNDYLVKSVKISNEPENFVLINRLKPHSKGRRWTTVSAGNSTILYNDVWKDVQDLMYGKAQSIPFSTSSSISHPHRLCSVCSRASEFP